MDRQGLALSPEVAQHLRADIRRRLYPEGVEQVVILGNLKFASR